MILDDERKMTRPYALKIIGGVSLFFAFQYVIALVRLSGGSGSMKNKFSALAQDKYMDFLVMQNLYVLLGYAILAILFTVVLCPLVDLALRKWPLRRWWVVVMAGLCGSFLIHGFFTLRLVKTRPYFLDDAKFGYWYFEVLNVVPETAKPAVFFVIFTILPWVILAYVGWWYYRHLSKRARIAVGAVLLGLGVFLFWRFNPATSRLEAVEKTEDKKRLNVIIIGSDSLRGDKLGYVGYHPRRTDGAAAAGVSPNIDALAKRSINLANCLTPIASTLESGTTLMSSQYPHTHGFRQMYPSEETVNAAKAGITPIAQILRKEGYDTAAIGDWCAGYYEVMPLGFEHISVSSFDNFKIYMSQAVVLAHFVIPLYFDHEIGYDIFPQLGSFAQFVTPQVVTNRVTQRLDQVSKTGEPFFWHVFYSCNHLPYRNPEPYSSMFTDPHYEGPNKNGVAFDIDEFIGGTDLENKWKALPDKEIQQIRDLYDGCTRQFDDNVGDILKALEKRGLSDNTIVIITADHGDNLYEEGVTLGHGLTFNGGLQANHIPLLVRLPNAEPRTISEQVRLIDILPTLADLLEVEKPLSWEGQSFSKWLDGSETPKSRAFYGETGFPFIQFQVKGIERPKLPPMDQMTYIEESFNYQFVLKKEFEQPLVEAKQRCLVTGKWKLICTPTMEGKRHFGLFQRVGGTFSEADVAANHPDVLDPMRMALERWMDERVETSLDGIFPKGE
ncbi:MAG: sulfatase-like hydrolase/transferase [Verrucomicrobiota bacterium]